MGRTLAGTWRTGSLFGVRGKCRYSNHESVTLVGDQWMGESSGSFGCDLAPEDQCTTCAGAGFHELAPGDPERADYPDGRRPCPPCEGQGYVSGPHWPWRHPAPGAVREGQ